MEHKHDLIDLNEGNELDSVFACRICKQIISKPCRFCGHLPCSEEKIGCLYE